MKSPTPTLTLKQAKAIREIKQRLAELELMRLHLADKFSFDADLKPTRKGAKAKRYPSR